jgi:hypothetical protein
MYFDTVLDLERYGHSSKVRPEDANQPLAGKPRLGRHHYEWQEAGNPEHPFPDEDARRR